MLFVLSPAKSLDFSPQKLALTPTMPAYLARSEILIECLRQLTPTQLGNLMTLSDKLSVLNVARYADWTIEHHASLGKPALLAFNGDVYDGLSALTLSSDAVNYLQNQLLILSGLYGVLRPLDLILPHRLEMGTALSNPVGKNLYAYWHDSVLAQIQTIQPTVIVNLASVEYFSVIPVKLLKTRVVHCVFEENKKGQSKVISFFAKRARGLMMRYAAQNHITKVTDLQNFAVDGYQFQRRRSSEDQWVFVRNSHS